MTDSRRSYRGKRLLDLVILALVALPALLAVAICAVMIYREDGYPALLRQTRAGRDGRPFTLLKLRTMAPHSAPESETPDMGHITRIGRVLRRLSLDELPQLINVARGEMSLVGPRPTFGHRAERYDARERQRLRALPGLTGLAQIHGRNRLTWPERTDLDLRYVAEQNLLLDLRILMSSIWVILTGDGVYGHPGEETTIEPDPQPTAVLLPAQTN